MTRPSAIQTRPRMTADDSRNRSATTRTPFPMIAATGVTGTAGPRYVHGGVHEDKQKEKHDTGGGRNRADVETRNEQSNKDAARDDRDEGRSVPAVKAAENPREGAVAPHRERYAGCGNDQ